MINLGALGGVGSQAFNLNDNGDVVGMTYQADGRYVPFLYSNGQMTNLEALAGVSGVWHLNPAAINNSGQIVGQAYEPEGATLAPFYYTSGQLHVLTNHPVGIYPTGFAVDINDSGFACGASDLAMHSFVAVYISETEVIPIPAVQTIPNETSGVAINNAGHLLVSTFNGGNFTYRDNVLISLGPFPPDYFTLARDLNDFDDVVGDNELTPFFYHDGTVCFLNDQIPRHSGWILQRAYGLNNGRQIVGFGLHHGKTRAFLLTPAH
jgi:probable HAF family extracellular repeat protein